MPSGQHSYIDIAALDAVRLRFAAGDALALMSPALDQVIWANGPGATLLGYSDVASSIGAEPRIGLAAKRQITATAGYPRIGIDRAITVRLASGMTSRAVSFLASEIVLPGGEDAILLVAPSPAAGWRDPIDAAGAAIGVFGQTGQHAAIIDAEAKVTAASSGFEGLGIGTETLQALVAEAAGERLVKRTVRTEVAELSAGLARLADEPAIYLLVVTDEPQSEETAVPSDATTMKDAAAEAHHEDNEQGWADQQVENPQPVESGTGEQGLDAAAPIAAEADEQTPTMADEPDVNEPAPGTAAEATVMASETASGSELKTADYEDRYFVGGDHDRETDAMAADPEVGSAGDTGKPEEHATDAGEETVPQSNAVESLELAKEAASPVEIDRSAAPVRFVWKTDAEGRFSEISQEFAATIGQSPADLLGIRFRDAARTLGFDAGGEIAGLLERRDTWSGRSVMWPVAGTDLRIPVDLAALPAYDRDRQFIGFRGFGVARAADAVVDPEAPGFTKAGETARAENAAATSEPTGSGPEDAGTADADTSSDDPFRGEVPILTIVPKQDRRHSDKVIRLAEHRQPANGNGLSPGERNAFREIGDRLKKESGAPAGVPAESVLRADNDRAPQDAQPVQTPDHTDGVDHDTGAGQTKDHITGGEPSGIAEVAWSGPHAPTDGGIESEPVAELAGDLTGTAEAESDSTQPSAKAEPSIEAEPASDGAGPDLQPEPAAVSRDVSSDRATPQAAYLPSAFAPGAAEAERAPMDTSILEQLPVPVLIHSGDRLHYANREFLEFTGYDSAADLEAAGGLGVLFGEPYPAEPDNAEPGRKLRLRTSEGLEYPVEAFLQSVPWGSGKSLLLSLRQSRLQPISYPASRPAPQPVATDSNLEERIDEMRAIVDTATDGVVLMAPDGSIRSISRPAEALFGFDSKDVAGKPFTSLFAIESQRAARDYLHGLSDNGVASVLNDGREVIGREAQGGFIPLFMTMGKLPNDSGYCAVVRDITQWKRAEEELTQARSLAERASSQKTDFLARVSHEIRTPLNAIIGFSELMLDEKFGTIGNDRYRDYLRDINRSGNHVLDLVNDLLDISKIEAGQQEMSYEAVSLNDTLSETVAMMQPQANRERVIIRSSFASRLPEVVADLRSVRQIALNLLSNAIRYTPAGGQVIVSTAYEASGDVIMRVRDTGIGMSQPEIEQALKPFKQINALKRARGDGTGLGLPLTKAMVEANRARFIITSTPGEGTLVEITFPSTRVLAG